MSAPAPELAIVIVSYNARGDLEACLGSLAAAPPAVPHEILVVDNASSDGGPAMIRDRWPSVRLLPQARNLGFAAGCNVGIRASAAGLILLLNGDTLVPPHAIDRLVDRLRASDDVAVAGPRLVDAEGLPELSFGRMISPLAELRQKILTGLLARRVGPAVARVRRLTAVERAPRLGERRLPARAPGRRGRGRAARRAVLPLHGGRGLLRGHPRARPARPLHAGGRDRPPARPVPGGRLGNRPSGPTGPASSPSTPSTARAGRRG